MFFFREKMVSMFFGDSNNLYSHHGVCLSSITPLSSTKIIP